MNLLGQITQNVEFSRTSRYFNKMLMNAFLIISVIQEENNYLL